MVRVVSSEVAGAAGRPVAVDLHVPDGDGRAPLVVVCHGFKGFKDWGFFPDLCNRLATAGFAALRLNFSHNGVGLQGDALAFRRLDLFEEDRMSYRLADLGAVIDAVRSDALPGSSAVDPSRLALFGHSLGGAAVLLAHRHHGARALVTLASVAQVAFRPEQVAVLEREGRLLIPNARTGQDMPVGRVALDDIREHGFDLAETAGTVQVPWLIVHGSSDPSVPVDAARRLHGWCTSGTSETHIVEGADHVMDVRHPWAGPSPAYEDFVARAVEHLRRHL